MLVLLFVIGFVGMCYAIGHSDPYENDAPCGLVLFEMLVLLGIVIVGGALYNTSYLIPKKIAMYEEENTIIESKIETAVEKYMEYEQGVIFEVAPDEDCVTLVSLYPELKSDSLVQGEIEVYLKNNEAIRALKEKQINKSVWKFLLFFGH